MFLLASFFVFTPSLLALSLFLLSLNFRSSFLSQKPFPKVAYAALPAASGTLKTQITFQDARVTVVKDFFQKYNSVLYPYASDIVSTADKYGLDYRLVPAIAMQESTLCKKAPKDSYNCWGFGIYGKKVTRFNNFSQAIDTVTKTLARQYKAQGLETPQQIMTKYTPSSNGSWAIGVNTVMDQLSI